MATTIHEPPQPNAREISNDGGWHGVPPVSGDLLAVDDSSPASRTGIGVALAAITMTFITLTSAMIVRQGASTDWQHFTLPSVLYVNTLVLLAGSFVLEIARRRVTAYLRGAQVSRSAALRWLCLTLALGLVFVAGQCTAWPQLRSQGLYMATNPSSSFFYLFTAAHAVHVLGGLLGLMLVVWRFSRPAPRLRVSSLSTVSYYSHFMGVLWLYLLLLLWMRI